jgi:hypothetical protein
VLLLALHAGALSKSHLLIPLQIQIVIQGISNAARPFSNYNLLKTNCGHTQANARRWSYAGKRRVSQTNLRETLQVAHSWDREGNRPWL